MKWILCVIYFNLRIFSPYRALWHHKESYPCSWQLDPTEGPSRMRKRLQRCHLEIAPKFFMDGAPAKSMIRLDVLGLLYAYIR